MGQILIHVFHALIIITLVEPSAYLAIYHASIAPMKELAHAQLVDLLIRVPGMLSFLAYNAFEGEVKGIKNLQKEYNQCRA